MANVVRYWDPFREAMSLRQAMDRLFEEARVGTGSWGAGADSGWFPMDLRETGEEFVAECVLPGVKAEDINLSIEGNLLTISCEIPTGTVDQQATYHLRERGSGGRFHRQVTLPTQVQRERVEAHLENGILLLRMPKAEEARQRRIQVQAGPGAQRLAAA